MYGPPKNVTSCQGWRCISLRYRVSVNIKDGSPHVRSTVPLMNSLERVGHRNTLL
jgi:hypothetical protein